MWHHIPEVETSMKYYTSSTISYRSMILKVQIAQLLVEDILCFSRICKMVCGIHRIMYLWTCVTWAFFKGLGVWKSELTIIGRISKTLWSSSWNTWNSLYIVLCKWVSVVDEYTWKSKLHDVCRNLSHRSSICSFMTFGKPGFIRDQDGWQVELPVDWNVGLREKKYLLMILVLILSQMWPQEALVLAL
jgi:hypothetical protein